jgi:hypothetical protein
MVRIGTRSGLNPGVDWDKWERQLEQRKHDIVVFKNNNILLEVINTPLTIVLEFQNW